MTRLRRRISCQQLVELASDYLDGVLTITLTEAVERHLARCPSCPNYLAQLRLTMRLTGALRVEDVPDELLDTLSRAWEEHRGEDGDGEDGDGAVMPAPIDEPPSIP